MEKEQTIIFFVGMIGSAILGFCFGVVIMAIKHLKFLRKLE